MDRMTHIKELFKRHTVGWLPGSDIAWLILQVTDLRQAAQADQLTIEGLRREIDTWVAIAEDAQALLAQAQRGRDELQAKLAQANRLAVSLTEQVMR